MSEINIVTTSIFKGRRISLFPRGEGGVGFRGGFGSVWGKEIVFQPLKLIGVVRPCVWNAIFPLPGEIGGRIKKRAVKCQI